MTAGVYTRYVCFCLSHFTPFWLSLKFDTSTHLFTKECVREEGRRGGSVRSWPLPFSSSFSTSLVLCPLPLCLSPPLSSDIFSLSSPLNPPPPPLPPSRLSSPHPFIFRYRQNGAEPRLKTHQVCGVSNCTQVCVEVCEMCFFLY